MRIIIRNVFITVANRSEKINHPDLLERILGENPPPEDIEFLQKLLGINNEQETPLQDDQIIDVKKRIQVFVLRLFSLYLE